MKAMRFRLLLPALMLGAGLLLPTQTPALAKTSYKQRKIKSYKVSRKFKAKKFKTKKYKAGKYKARTVKQARVKKR